MENVAVGTRYGMRVVLSKESSKLASDGSVEYARYRVRCDCGKESVISGQNLRKAKSCGCARIARCKRGHLRIPENLIGNTRCCKLCRTQWAVEHPLERKRIARESSRRRRMATLYNLTEEQYEEMYKKQKGLCALPSCGESATDIDHCHKQNRTRGLMCNKHNTALGFFNDSPQLLREAADYLEKFNGEQ